MERNPSSSNSKENAQPPPKRKAGRPRKQNNYENIASSSNSCVTNLQSRNPFGDVTNTLEPISQEYPPPLQKSGRKRKENNSIGSSSNSCILDFEGYYARKKRKFIINQRKQGVHIEKGDNLIYSAHADEFLSFVASDTEPDDPIDDSGFMAHEQHHDENIENIRPADHIFKDSKMSLQNQKALHRFTKMYELSRIVKPGMTANGYYDHGDPLYTCMHCNAYMWFGERINKKGSKSKPIFSMCCKHGKVSLPLLKTPPSTLLALLYNDDDNSKNFRELIRAYNMMFSFTSLGGKIVHNVNNGKGPYLFQMHGENYHSIGDMLPGPDQDPAFLQLYMHDTANETKNRIKAYGQTGNIEKVKPEIVDIITKMLNAHNPHVKAFRSARDKLDLTQQPENLKLRLPSGRNRDARTHNLPTSNEVAGLIPGDFQIGMEPRDVIIESRTGKLQRISELHPAYLPLQYPLLFPYGEDGFRLGIDIGFVDTSGRKRKTITMREFFAFRIQERKGESPTIVMSGKLYQQFLVDVYTMIESNRLTFLRLNQTKLRCEFYEKLMKASAKGHGDLSKQGKKIQLPSSFVGGRRYMMQNYLDAMATCKYFGFPDLFITITCNPKWPEITRYLEKNCLKSEDKPDVACRVFKIKLDSLIEDLTKNNIFGKVNSAMYTIEFQKRGLPHAHLILFMHPDSKLPTGDDIDKIISAEIPDKDLEPHLYEVVSDMMIHGPCGLMNKSNVCMQNGKCTKFFPKPFSNNTRVDDAGFPIYKRRNDKRYVTKKTWQLDNSYVIPYNKTLSIRYRAHINVEWCNQTRAVKYLFKYINKGPDYVRASLGKDNDKDNEKEEVDDEITKHLTCRYISATEATWRILAFNTHFRTTAVEKLSFHLPGEQVIVYEEDDDVDNVINRPSVGKSKFLAFMDYYKKNPKAKKQTYADFPTEHVWVLKNREWKDRQRGFAIGRITYVPPSCGEPYYLRVLLNIQPGPTCFEDIRTVKKVVYPTFKAACGALGLLDDDKEYIEAIREASQWAPGQYIRTLFVVILISCNVQDPPRLWDATWEFLSDGILLEQRGKKKNPSLSLNEQQIKNFTLVEIEILLRKRACSLSKFQGMPIPDEAAHIRDNNSLISEEQNYNKEELRDILRKDLPKLTDEQRGVYQEIMDAVNNGTGGMFFVYGFGGTGKTFIWSVLGAAIRSEGHILLNVASSGIAALLLKGGRTAHSRFGIPLNVNESSTCSMTAGTDQAELVKLAKLIIWDEAPMMSKHCFETLDRSLRDILGCDEPFGGKVIVFGGDFRQILPVITDGGREQTVMASLNASPLWKRTKVLKLTKNMRLLANGLTVDEERALREFAEWILAIGDGKIKRKDAEEFEIDIPEDLLIKDCAEPIKAIVREVYGESFASETEPLFFQGRAILSPRNSDVDIVNEHMLDKLQGDAVTYLSSDSIDTSDKCLNDDMVYSQEFLNSIKISGLPNHSLKLKVGAPIMLLRNIDPRGGLCNGTRLLIKKFDQHVIEARIINGDRVGDRVHIPRMFVTPPDGRFPFRMRRKQFPIALAFAMSINKSQGQTLSTVGLYLPRPVFTHGQLYVAVSRVTTRKGLKILITDKEGNPQKKTQNVVYTEVFQNIK